MNIRKYFYVLLIYIFSLSNAYSIEPDVFVQSTVNRASKILSEDISKEKKIDKLKVIAKETVDIRGIGFYTLGSIRKTLDNDHYKTLGANALDFSKNFSWDKIVKKYIELI